jgi:rhodanese-related sulfurtransferase
MKKYKIIQLRYPGKVIMFLLLTGALAWWVLPLHIFAIGGWSELDQMVDRVQKDLNYISTDDLFSMISQEGSLKPLIIDVREPEEFNTSHLVNAINLKEASDIVSLLKKPENQQRPVVVYCSVGYRSAIVGNEIKREVSNKVFNLKGSIFKWANEGKPVFRAGQAVKEVHPYDRNWGKLLEKDLWPAEFK